MDKNVELITIEDLCSLLSIGRNMAYKLLEENKIKAFRIGRHWKIPKSSVDEYIKKECNIIYPIRFVNTKNKIL